jgi:hypothetical protein
VSATLDVQQEVEDGRKFAERIMGQKRIHKSAPTLQTLKVTRRDFGVRDSSDEEDLPDKKKNDICLDDDTLSVFETEIGTDVSTKGEYSCVMCFENKRQLAPAECLQLSLCFACAKKLMDQTDVQFKCPLCKVPIMKKMLHIFVP